MKINLKITTQCPADCLCCKERLNNFNMYYKNKACTEELVEQILKLYQYKGDIANHLSITGGEPTLVADLPYYVKRFTDNNISVGVDTNGWNIDEKWLSEMEKAKLNYILLSVYSLEKDKFNYLRGSSDGKLYSSVSKTIKLLKKYKDDGGSIQVRLQCVLMKQNYQEIPELLTCAIESGFDAFSTSYYISNVANEKLLMSKSDIDNFISRTLPKVRILINNCKISEKVKKENLRKIDSFFCFNGVSNEDIEKGIYRTMGTTCNEKNRVAIYPNGDVVPCLGFDYYMKQKYIINIFENGNLFKIIEEVFGNFWEDCYNMCSKCSSGYQVWFPLK